jgi:hypothetical protein
MAMTFEAETKRVPQTHSSTSLESLLFPQLRAYDAQAPTPLSIPPKVYTTGKLSIPALGMPIESTSLGWQTVV